MDPKTVVADLFEGASAFLFPWLQEQLGELLDKLAKGGALTVDERIKLNELRLRALRATREMEGSNASADPAADALAE